MRHVTSADIKKYEPMVAKIAHEVVWRYWGSPSHTSGANRVVADKDRQQLRTGRNGTDPSLFRQGSGVSMGDLEQEGRIWVLESLRSWQPGLGNKESTHVYTHLKRKFCTLSKNWTRTKHHGMTRPPCPCRTAYAEAHPEENVTDFKCRCVLEYKEARKSGIKTKKCACLERCMNFRFTDPNVSMEENLNMIHSIEDNVVDILDRIVSAEELSGLHTNKTATPAAPAEKGKRYKMSKASPFMALLSEKGYPSQKHLAAALNVSPPALNNVVKGRSNGTPQLRLLIQEKLGMSVNDIQKLAKGGE